MKFKVTLQKSATDAYAPESEFDQAKTFAWIAKMIKRCPYKAYVEILTDPLPAPAPDKPGVMVGRV